MTIHQREASLIAAYILRCLVKAIFHGTVLCEKKYPRQTLAKRHMLK